MGVQPCAKRQKGTWHLVSYQPGGMITRLMKACGDRLADQVCVVNLRLKRRHTAVALSAISTVTGRSSVGLSVCGAFSLSP